MNLSKYILFTAFFICLGCKKTTETTTVKVKNSIEYANGLEIHNYDGFTVMKITKPWPDATKTYTYICAKSNENLPDSLYKYTFIQIPVSNLVATSTTHIPSLVALNETDKLIGFPHLEYISSEIVRKSIDLGHVKELSDNESLNFEKTIDLQPQVIIGLSMDSETSKFNQFEKAGIPVIYNADWVETSPLGKAEWIKFFGVLFNKQEQATDYFNSIVKEYEKAKKQVENVQYRPSVLSGSVFQDVWYMPQGGSWMAQFINDAGGNYLWSDTQGTGSLSLSFETVFEKAMDADFWIGPGEFNSFDQMLAANKHYGQFKAFQQKQVYSYSMKKGATGGLIFYEEASNRPDLVLKDLISIFHPNALPDYQPTFIEPLK
ncbi:iron complex transport system substrate-binding protein [Paenimyroides aquimaris]|uniref:Iron complex transport system substrate-binding protein n=1 Tax=Paenimyroides marinum TaxID=1159016 RepID=A0A1H6M6J3_9FLAO|nr:ABC transporter substrate-binding protein [Paenimyroides aquimaris]SEH93226.1 iron complex transport system substrate-binding protein [Paenimyroides aquimaris]